MSSSLLWQVCQTQIDLVEARVSAWRQAPPGLDAAGDVAEVLEVYLAYPAALQRADRAFFDQVAGGQLEGVSSAVPNMPALFEALARHGASLKEALDRLQEQGCTLRHADRLASARTEIDQLRERFLSSWPHFVQSSRAQALAAAARGEYLDVDDAFAQVLGVSKADLLHRLEDHKRRRAALGME